MKFFLLWLSILIPFWANSQENYRTERHCGKYSEWFGKDTIKWNKEDTLTAIEYSKKLYKLFKPVKKF